ncbi:MAG: hypothetical protein IJK81_11485 [Selenomonadaceae bacterium]|nr:hypothetical protein [Selenomonadaceae bacterium]
MKSIYEPNLILPESITGDEKILALAAAIDEQLKLLSGSAKQTLFIPRLDELSGEVLNILADQMHIDFFDAVNLSEKKKRNLIRQSIAQHRRLGTRWAVLQVLKEFFEEPTLQEIGNFYFRISSRGYTGTPEEEKMFWAMLNHSKNVRSWLAGLDFDFSPEEPTKIYAGVAMAISGFQEIQPERISNQTTTLYAGTALHIDGDIGIEPYSPPQTHKVLVHAGHAMLIVGNITIANYDSPTLHQNIENPNADLLIAGLGIPR